MIVGVGDVGSGGDVVTGLCMVDPEHAVSAMVRVIYIQEDFFNVENLMGSLTRSGLYLFAGISLRVAMLRRVSTLVASLLNKAPEESPRYQHTFITKLWRRSLTRLTRSG